MNFIGAKVNQFKEVSLMHRPDPKPHRNRLKRNSVAWKRLVDDLYARELSACQGCHKWLRRDESAPHHKQTVGSGGEDVLDNLILLCKNCHLKIDSGELTLK